MCSNEEGAGSERQTYVTRGYENGGTIIPQRKIKVELPEVRGMDIGDAKTMISSNSDFKLLIIIA